MTEIKMENGKHDVYKNGNFGATGVRHKIPDQVGDDRKVKCLGMMENIGSAGMTDRVKRTEMTGRNKTHRDGSLIEGMC